MVSFFGLRDPLMLGCGRCQPIAHQCLDCLAFHGVATQWFGECGAESVESDRLRGHAA